MLIHSGRSLFFIYSSSPLLRKSCSGLVTFSWRRGRVPRAGRELRGDRARIRGISARSNVSAILRQWKKQWAQIANLSLGTTILCWHYLNLGETTHKDPGTIRQLVKRETVPCVFCLCYHRKEISSRHKQLGLERSADSMCLCEVRLDRFFTQIQFCTLGGLQNVYETTNSISPALDCTWSFSIFPTKLIFGRDWLTGFAFLLLGLIPPPSPNKSLGLSK